MSDLLTAERISSYLSEGSPVVRVICLDSIDSTNNYAKSLILEGDSADDGVLIAANEQTAGRGRRGHSFFSPADTGLYMTVILKPHGDIADFQMITIAASAAVCRALERLTPLKPMIKWVNDIYLTDHDETERKVCGILSEAVSVGGEVKSVIVGIGVNVTTCDFGAELNDRAGSIGIGVCRAELAANIAEELVSVSGHLGDPELLNYYRRRSMLTGRHVRWLQDERERFGTVRGISDDGGLIVMGDDGISEILRSGEVCEIRPAG